MQISNSNRMLLDLDWNWHKFRSDEATDDYYDAHFSDDEKDVFRCHLFEIDHLQLLDHFPDATPRNHLIPRDPRNGHTYPNFMADHTCCTVPKLFNGFTVKSQLHKSQHSACIRAINRVKKRFQNTDQSGAPMADNEKKDLEVFTSTFLLREKEKEGFLRFAENHFRDNYKSLIERVKPFLSDFVKDKWTRAVSAAQHSNPGQFSIQTAISLASEMCGEVTLSVGPTVSQSGRICGYKVRDVKKRGPPSKSQLENMESMKPAFSTASTVNVALAKGANVILSPSVVRQLIDQPDNLADSWMIPFEIVDYDANDFQKICYISDPLPGVDLSIRAQHLAAFECHVRACSLSQDAYCLDQHIYVEPSTADNAPPEILSLDESLRYKLTPFDEFLNKHPNNKYPSVDPPQTLRVADLNVSSDPLRLLARLNPTAFDASKRIDPPTLVNVSVKLEYQPQFGAARMTVSELIGEWCHHIFEPNTITDRYRIVAETGHILSITRLTQTQIESEMLRLHKIRPNLLLQRLYQILHTISRLPANKYLLRHTSKHENKAMVYTPTPVKTPNSLDILQMYTTDPDHISRIHIPWTPIDDMEVTQVHRAAQVAPCAFPHNIFVPPRQHQCAQNDRTKVLTKAKQKLANKQKATAALKKRKLKNNAMHKTSAILAARKKVFSQPIGETIDPYLMFDSKGNVLVPELMAGPKITADTSAAATSFKDEKPPGALATFGHASPKPKAATAVKNEKQMTINYADYVRQASAADLF